MGVQVKRRTTPTGPVRDDAGMGNGTEASVRMFGNTPLARFLVGATDAPPPLDSVKAAFLSGATLARTPAHPERAVLTADARFAAVRHMAVKTELLRLLRAWHGRGIEAFVYKGFHLAEFVYPDPSRRPYHDVDLLLPPQDAVRACAAAEELGWEVQWRGHDPDEPRTAGGSTYSGHETAQLRHPGLELTIDLHRRLAHNMHNHVPLHRVPSRLTERAWDDAERIVWHGIPLRIPRPVDAVVFGLALNRCWGSDAWRVKPRDYTDLEAIAKRYGISRDAITERATALGVRTTVDIYLSRCDPYHRRLLLGAPGWVRLRAWNLLVTPERGPYDLVRWSMGTVEVVRATTWWIRAWPAVGRARRLLRDPAALARWLVGQMARPPGTGRMDPRAWRDFRRAVHRHLRLARVPAAEREATAALAALPWLRRRGRAVGIDVVASDARSARLRLDGAPMAVTPPSAGSD
jgi:hypothetical protein